MELAVVNEFSSDAILAPVLLDDAARAEKLAVLDEGITNELLDDEGVAMRGKVEAPITVSAAEVCV
ncbi:hypothetical protein Tdes44962_MAKER07995 [Teratosphaeria destructans]|uniref:Uncharacterized protein n=1 Tax=Teratosphaeria destructans TaxID=418781 RepID=A0A9W7SXN1_9PEZI|nr:hypothetical protein Tdes44962_MAKER07995 [Teratosphaeria destructans]